MINDDLNEDLNEAYSRKACDLSLFYGNIFLHDLIFNVAHLAIELTWNHQARTATGFVAA